MEGQKLDVRTLHQIEEPLWFSFWVPPHINSKHSLDGMQLQPEKVQSQLLSPQIHNLHSVSGANCGVQDALRSTNNAWKHSQSWMCAVPHAVAAALMAVMLPLQRGQSGGLLCCWHKVEKQSRHSWCSHLLSVTWKTQSWDQSHMAIACNSWCCCLRQLAVSGMETIKRLHQPCTQSLVLVSKELCIGCSWGIIHEVHHIQ